MNTPVDDRPDSGSGSVTPQRRALCLGVLGTAALLAGALTLSGPALAAPELPEITVYSSLDVQAPVQLITAQRQGFFKQFGLNVVTKYYQSATEIVPGMIGGSILLGHGGLLNPLVVADQGFPVKVIAMVADYQRSSQLVVSKAVSGLSPGELAGKTLVGPDVPVMRMFWNNWAAANRIDPKSVKWLNTAPSDALVAFNSGRADMLLLWAPHTTNAVQAGRDSIVHKRRYSGFFGSDLDLTLREMGVESVIVIGWSTSLAVMMTALDAWQHGYSTTVLSDLTIAHAWGGHSIEENQQWTLDLIKAFAFSRIATSSELMAG